MIYPMFAIRDVKVGFMPPTCDQSEQSAVRSFSYAVNNEGVMNYAPKDFDLYKVASFDTESGVINSQVPELVCSGSSVFGDKNG